MLEGLMKITADGNLHLLPSQCTVLPELGTTGLAGFGRSIRTEPWSSVIVTVERETFGATNVFSDRGIETEGVDDCSWIVIF